VEKLPGANCDSCPLKSQKLVPPYSESCGSGLPSSPVDIDILFVGESPGYNEVNKGIPFVGDSGQLLHGAEEIASINRNKTAYTNAVPCEPNGNDYDYETASNLCRDRLIKEVNSFSPRVVVALGTEALHALTNNSKLQITKVKGELLQSPYFTQPLLPLLHPSFIMRQAFNEFIGFARTLIALKKNYLDNRFGDNIPSIHSAFTDIDAYNLLSSLTSGKIWCDIETTSLTAYPGNIISISICDEKNFIISLDWTVLSEETLYLLASILGSSPSVWHNGIAFDVIFLNKELGKIFPGFKVNISDDTLLKHYSTDESTIGSGGQEGEGYAATGGSHSLKEISTSTFFIPNWEEEVLPYTYVGRSKKKRDYTKIPKDKLLLYNGYDSYYTKLIDEYMEKNLWEEPDKKLYETVLMPVGRRFVKSQMRGVYIDVRRLLEVNNILKEQIEYTEEKASKLTRNYVQLGSTQQVQKILFGDKSAGGFGLTRPIGSAGLDKAVTLNILNGLVARLGKDIEDKVGEVYIDKIRDENVSGRADIPEEIMKEFPKELQMLRYLLDYRSLTKLQNTYVKGLVDDIYREDSCIHPSISLAATVTGRGAARNPSIMNIVHNLLIRSFFKARPGYVLVEKDQAQFELRIYACVTNDQNMIEIFRAGRDLHHENSIVLFGDRYLRAKEGKDLGDSEAGEIYTLFRKRAKYTVFGRLYNRTAYAVALEHGVTLNEAQRWLNELDKQYPEAKGYSKRQLQKILDEGEIQTILGRRRRFPIVTDYNIGRLENQGCNFEIQSLASDLNLLSIVDLEPLEEKYGFHCMFPVHDSIMFEVPIVGFRECMKVIDEVMVGTGEKYLGKEFDKVPFKVDTKVGDNWGGMFERKEQIEEFLVSRGIH